MPPGRNLRCGPEETLRKLFHHGESQDGWRMRLRRFLLDIDSRIDFGMYQAQDLGARAL